MTDSDPATSPSFLITIDTECDDAWSRPQVPTTENVRFLPRFQALCEEFGFLPTYLVNHEMTMEPRFRSFAATLLDRKAAEIGMHMHCWDSPPVDDALGERDWYDQPYATEYPPELVHRKAAFMTDLLQDIFERKMTSHRAGRWGFNAAYARTLVELGYEVDCSVSPGIDWSKTPGLANGNGGPDYRVFPSKPYRLDLTDISRSGDSSLIELPMTIMPGWNPLHRAAARLVLGRGFRRDWLRPEGNNLDRMKRIINRATAKRLSYIQFTLHSSEFMPGGSPTFQTDESIEMLYRDMRELFQLIAANYIGRGLTEHARLFETRATLPAS